MHHVVPDIAQASHAIRTSYRALQTCKRVRPVNGSLLIAHRRPFGGIQLLPLLLLRVIL
jgi:hypothetical protein